MMGAAAPKRIESHRDLIVWQKSMDLVVQVYPLTGALPPSEIYRLVAQTTRAAASVPANIAEGHAPSSRRDFANLLAIAKGSLMENRNLSDDRDSAWVFYRTVSPIRRLTLLITEISKMLTVLRRKLLS
jgi:four helix bundle protein